jgi:ferrous iron transport protein B
VTAPAAEPLRSSAPSPSPRKAESAALVPLIGRPNSGKSSLYNRLTGGDAKVGNFPGVTVDILEANLTLPDGSVATVVDLPGLYTIESIVDPKTDEGVARGFIEMAVSGGRPLAVVQVIDATKLALGLRLTRELAAIGLPLIVAVTQKDILESEGRALDAGLLASLIGAPVIAVSAREPAARDTVLAAIAARLDTKRPAPKGPLDRPKALPTWEPSAVAARVLEEAPRISRAAERRRTFTARADAVLLHPAIGPVVFLTLMSLVFASVFLVADPVTHFLDGLVDTARVALSHRFGNGMLTSFLAGGLLGGAGTVLAFMPQIVILTLAMEILDATGYLARGAFLVDRLLRLLGLSGRSFLPLLMAHACAVPAISATRIVRDPRERLTTILVLPLMSCSARIPVYALLLGTFFAASAPWVRAGLFVGLYFAGILSGLVASLVLRKSATKGKSLPLVLEIPAYRMPQLAVVARKAWQAATRFLRDVGSMILVVSAILWALLTLPMPGADRTAGETSAPIEHSIAAGVGRAIEPLTRPMGFDWRIDVGLIGSFGAREVMVGTMGVIFGIEDADRDPAPLSTRIREAKKPDGSPAYTRRTALALLAFFMIACQCMSTLAAVRRETRSFVWPAVLVAYTYVAAYVAAFAVYQVGGLLGVG